MSAFARNDASVLSRWWWEVDRWLLGAILLLAAIGIMLSFTAGTAAATRIGADPLLFARKQALILGPSLMMMLGVSLLTPRGVRRLAGVMLAGGLALLVLTLLSGQETKGAARWISIGVFSLQPSEFVKPAFVVVIASLFSATRDGGGGSDIPGVTIATALCLTLATLLLMQPDVKQTVIIIALWFTQYFLVGLPLAMAGISLAVCLAGAVGAYVLLPHVQNRVDRFLDPSSGDNYQVEQSIKAFSNGGLWGTGPGEGVVKNRLPDGHTDFVFSVAGEEFGLVFCLLLVLLYIFIATRGLRRAWRRGDLFSMLAATGLVMQFSLQALVNMASSLRLAPATGVTLPFISYGGSSLVALSLGVGMLLAITRDRSGTEP